MAYYPQSAVGLNYITYPVGPASAGLSVNTAAGANTKGSYVEVIASSPFDSVLIQILILLTTATNGLQMLTDIATGAGGAEAVCIPDIMRSNHATTASDTGGLYILPLEIASGTRIAARCQASTGSSTEVLAITLVAAGGAPGIATFVNYGANTVDSGGTQIDPGGSANTKGSYTQITASTSAVIQSLLSMTALAGNNSAAATATWAYDIATGAGGAEVVLIPDLRMQTRLLNGSTASVAMSPRSQPFLTYIAASTRIAVRASCNITDATDRLIDVAFIAGTAPAEPSSGGEHSAVF